MDDNTRKRPTLTKRSSRRHFVIPGPGASADLTRRAVFDGMGQGGGFGFAVGKRVQMFGMYSESQLNTMIETEAYIPIATADELNALRNATAQTFGAGSKWQGTYTSGVDKKYVLIDDIDLDVAPYNTGEGWVQISGFEGVFDGAGRFVTGLFINRASFNQGLFGQATGEIKHLWVDGYVLVPDTITGVGILAASPRASNGTSLSVCGVSGLVQATGAGSTNLRVGGFGYLGEFNTENILSKNLFSAAIVLSPGHYTGGVFGFVWTGATAQDSLSIGSVVSGGTYTGGAIGRVSGGFVTNSYYNTTTSGQSDTNRGTPKTTAELLALAPADWDTSIWEFKADRYPIQRIFGEQAVHRAPPLQPTATIDGGNIVLTWADAPSEVDLPDGYFVYQSIDSGPWTKLNATAVTAKTYTVTTPAVGEHNYFVAAFYDDAAYKIKETGNSQTVTETIA